jgi:diguanylate cyclase (GGDEF)-like protein
MRNSKNHRNRFRFFVLFALFIGTALPDALCAGEDGEVNSLLTLGTGWEYCWNDARKVSALPGDDSEASSALCWQPIGFPSNPADRDGRSLVWFRLRLPDHDYRDPRLFITSIDINADFFLGEEKIYSFGRIDGGGKGSFEGWPWHLIPLPRDSGGKTLYVRVYSDYHDIGLWGNILLGEGYRHMQRLFRQDNIRLVVAVVSLLISLVFLLTYIFLPEQQASLHLSLITFFLSLRVFSLMHGRVYIFEYELFWEYSNFFTMFLIVIFTTLFFEEIIQRKYLIITRLVRSLYTGSGVLLLVLGLSGLVPITRFYRGFDVGLVFTIILLGALAVQAGLSGNTEARLITVNLLIMAVLVLYSVLVSNSILPWNNSFEYLIVFQFSLGLAVILVRRFYLLFFKLQEVRGRLQAQSAELQQVNENLEAVISERTRQLEEANRALEAEKNVLHTISITDGLTGLYNRSHSLDRLEQMIHESKRYNKSLSVIMFDLDHFKKINDSHGHLLGDKVLEKTAEAFQYALRGADIAGRYGGEEFLVILPETDREHACMAAERIRERVAALRIGETELRFTISAGVAQLYGGEDADSLIGRADSALYSAKESGRNRVCSDSPS